MNAEKEKEILTLTEQYREQLQDADSRDSIRERQEWFRSTAAPLFRR
jgi:hypothetical protein